MTPAEQSYRDAWISELWPVVREYHESESAPETRIPPRVEKARDNAAKGGRNAA